MPTFADLPAHRQRLLVWKHMLEHDLAGVDRIVRRGEGKCASRERLSTQHLGAVLGGDSRFHLLIDGRPACGTPQADGTLKHTERCNWWTHDGQIRIQAPHDWWDHPGDSPRLTRSAYGWTEYTWAVTLTNQTIEPGLAPVHLRCQVYPSTSWPSYHGGNDPKHRLRARLATAFGPLCAICRRPGSVVDHDHFTGYARGLLCGDCNTRVDWCPHPAGCPLADYLNDPPARSLKLLYPNRGRRGTGDDQRRIELLGFDPLYRGPAAERL